MAQDILEQRVRDERERRERENDFNNAMNNKVEEQRRVITQNLTETGSLPPGDTADQVPYG